MAAGPLAVRWGAPPRPSPHAGVRELLPVRLANAGSARWHDTVHASYHWLDDRGNPIVWDGIRTALPRLSPGEEATVELTVQAPIPPGHYRLALDVVAEHRAWFSELGSPMLAVDVQVEPRQAEPNAVLPPGVEPGPDWADRVRAAHADGYAVVAGAVEWRGGPLHRRPHDLAPYEPGQGRVPGFSAPLLCPSLVPGVELERLADIAGLPAYAAPRDEPWVYDGRIVVVAGPAQTSG